jgi:NADH-quinone oxidoreductase subunit L
MFDLVALIPALPLAGFLALVLGPRLPRAAVTAVGVGSVGAALLVAFTVAWAFFASPPPDHVYVQTLWQWMDVGGLVVPASFHLDPLSLVFVLVVTGVGFLIHVYSTEYMAGDEGYRRFFAYMNLFVASMLVLVLAGNLLLLYLGWEGVGLCSYLLIGFWYKDPANARAAIKAFVVTRVGDAALAVGLLLIFVSLGTLDIQEAARQAPVQWAAGSTLAVAAAALLLGGAVGKSAQLPLQTWLPDAMAGPTPVSALIHAATMVTAGVYLIARTQVLFELAPAVMALVAVIGAVTLLLAGASALVQTDLKRVLAYSTISQIGYMFLALGVGAWGAGIFHFMTHAFFKSLLFLGAGAVILALHEEHDMRRMGGLRRRMPGTFWVFLIGGASLAAVPLVTAGFYSKDLILARAWAAPWGGGWLWAAGLAGAFITSVYTFRMVFLVFFGKPGKEPARRTGLAMGLPLAILAALSVVGGFVEVPASLGGRPFFTDFLATSFSPGADAPMTRVPLAACPPVPSEQHTGGQAASGTPVGEVTGTQDVVEEGGGPLSEGSLQILAAAVSLAGILIAYLLFMPGRAWTQRLAARGAGAIVHRWWLAGWGFDAIYAALFVRPLVWVARVNRADFIDAFYTMIARISRALNQGLALTQNGQVRWYAMGVALGAVLILAIVVLS